MSTKKHDETPERLLLRKEKIDKMFTKRMALLDTLAKYWIPSEEHILRRNIDHIENGANISIPFVYRDGDEIYSPYIKHEVSWKRQEDGKISRKITIEWEDVREEI